jgi:hypothetical protein
MEHGTCVCVCVCVQFALPLAPPCLTVDTGSWPALRCPLARISGTTTEGGTRSAASSLGRGSLLGSEERRNCYLLLV